MSETITGVALLCKDGRMWSLPRPARHGHLFALAAILNTDPEPCLQGFSTSWGRFATRQSAFGLATLASQIKGGQEGKSELFSEDLW